MRKCPCPTYALTVSCVCMITSTDQAIVVAGAIALENALLEDRQVYIAPSGGPYMGYLVKKGFLDLSDNYIFLAFRKTFRKLFLEKNFLRSFSPGDSPEQLREDTRFFSNHFYYFPHYWYSIPCASLKIFIETYYLAIAMLGVVLRIRPSRSSRLIEDTSM